MNYRQRLFAIVLLTLVLLASFGAFGTLHYGQGAAISVLTERYGSDRNAVNLNETVLNPSNVNATTFGRLYTLAVDGDVYAQPLYVPGLVFQGAPHNVLFVATDHNSLYALDADNSTEVILWHDNFGVTWNQNLYTGDIWDGQDGIMGTPVIDPNSNTLFVVAHHNGTSGATAPFDKSYFDLHAIDLISGSEKFGGPTVISASVAGTSTSAIGGFDHFDANQQLARPGLLLLSGKVYLAFGGTNDRQPYWGWLMAYNASNISQQLFVRNMAPDHIATAVWQAGSGIASDGTSIYVATGNGAMDADLGGTSYGDSIVKLNPSLTVIDWFAASNQCYLNQGDFDLGITGPMYLAASNEIFGGGKLGYLYALDASNLGHYHVNPARAKDTNCTLDSDPGDNTQIIQYFQTGVEEMPDTPLYWNNFLYTWVVGDYPKQWSFSTTTKKVTQTSVPASLGAYKSGGADATLMISANGSAPGTAILWGYQDNGARTGVLRAWNANSLTTELWDSLAKSADNVGTLAKFNVPTVANGRVYLATFSNRINVYGLYSSLNGTATPASTPSATATRTHHFETTSVYRPSNATFYLHFSNGAGTPETVIHYGAASDYPAVGDWLGTGITTIGVYDRSNGNFGLRDSNTPGPANHVFTMGIAGDMPIVGRWSLTATHDGVGIFRPSNGLIYLKNQLQTSPPDSIMVLGSPGDRGIAGDWNGKGYDSPGVFRPTNATFYLSNATTGTVFADYALRFGIGTDLPVAGDWLGQGTDGVGVFRGTTGTFYLKNTLLAGNPDNTFRFGVLGDLPIAGRWSNLIPAPPLVVNVTAGTPFALPSANPPGFDG